MIINQYFDKIEQKKIKFPKFMTYLGISVMRVVHLFLHPAPSFQAVAVKEEIAFLLTYLPL